MKSKALFLDRDGVINIEKNYLYKIEDFVFIPGVFETLRCFQEAGYLIIVITNQAGIGRGYYSYDDFYKLNNWMLDQFNARKIYISKVYFSPFHPEHGLGEYKKNSFCRKPNPGMILQAQSEFDIDLTASFLVGDKMSDIEAGLRAGVKHNILVKSGHKVNDIATNGETAILSSIKEVKQYFLALGKNK